jgi:ABC-type nitrate/sulfonate/bicarbonate transport system substrate-binding protein
MLRALTRARAFAKDNKSATVAILKRFVQIKDDELAEKIYDYHKRAETPDGRVDNTIAADTIRDSLQAEAIKKDVAVDQVFDFSFLPPR